MPAPEKQDALFCPEDPSELKKWGENFASATAKRYMCGYRDIYREAGLLHRLMIRFCDEMVKMKFG